MPPPALTRARAWRDYALIAVAYALGALVSWQRWTDPVTDFGLHLYVPWRLLEGEVLYRDLSWVFGPLAAYTNTALMAVFGVALRSLVLANLVLIAAFALLLRALHARIGGRNAGLVAAIAFLLLFAFPQYIFQANFNFVTPYSYDLTYSLMLALLCIALVIRVPGAGIARWALAGVCLGLVVLGKPEVLVALLAALACSAIVRRLLGERPEPRAWIAFSAGALLAPLAAVCAFALVLPLPQALRAAGGAWTMLLDSPMAAAPYYAWSAGTDKPVLNVSRMLLTALPWVLALLAGRVLERRVAFARTPALAAAALLLVAVPLLVVGGLGSAWIVQHGVRSLPLLLLAAALLVAAKLWQRPRDESGPQLAGCLVLLVFALALLGKIALAARFFHYGFALAAPGALLLCVLIVAPPAALRGSGALTPWTRLALGSVLACIVLAHLQASVEHYAKRDFRLLEGPDAMTVFDPRIDPRGAEVQAFIAWSRALPAEATVLVLPNGVMLDYLIRHQAGARFYMLTQPELLAHGEQRVLEAYRAHPPDFVVLLEQSNRLFGAFGDPQFGSSIRAWIEREYTLCGRFDGTAQGGQASGMSVLAHERCPAVPRT